MKSAQLLTGDLFAQMLRAGAIHLQAHKQAINDLNVFPIPDGDTGDNMLLTIAGGVDALIDGEHSVAKVARQAADGMLLSARGNSGVILSQLFDGIADGLTGLHEADCTQFGNAMKCGVQHAYQAVMEPAEGTILTVSRLACEFAAEQTAEDLGDYLAHYLDEAKRTLARTPDMLPILKNAEVVDSGGAGLICIVEGMRMAISGEVDSDAYRPTVEKLTQEINLDLFTEDSVLEYGYCTELLLRLQKCKTDPASFRIDTLTDFLQQIGDSVVAFQNGSMVKIHVHTMTPDKVLGFCQTFGEFLKIKIENMSLQHNNSAFADAPASPPPQAKRKKYGIVAVCSGDGIKQMFTDRGADVIVDGGQSMNPSAEGFLHAFRQINADTIFVLPNNANVILSAKQAANLYTGADIRVLESQTVGEGYAALAMFDSDAENADQLTENLQDAMRGVVTAEISRCVRNADLQEAELHAGDYIGFSGKRLLAKSDNRLDALRETIKTLRFSDYEICILLRGADADPAEVSQIAEYIRADYPGKELYTVDGLQEIYDYILILE